MKPRRHPRAQRQQLQRNAYSHPVGRAVAHQRIRSHLVDLRVHMLVLEHGEDCHDVLADAAWLVGMGTELALQLGHESLRRMHGTLRGLVQMAREGYRWQEHQRQPVDAALELAHTLLVQHDALAYTLMPGAEWLAQRFRLRQVDGTEVAGSEIYATAGQPTPLQPLQPSPTPHHGPTP